MYWTPSVLQPLELMIMKQIVDLLRQLRGAVLELEPLIDQALTKIDRGVVVYAGASL